jgi:hypothetical protein
MLPSGSLPSFAALLTGIAAVTVVLPARLALRSANSGARCVLCVSGSNL